MLKKAGLFTAGQITALREEVILVDASDRQVGTSEKLAAHRGEGQLHRAFSVFLFNCTGHMLLQRRSLQKYHFGGLWSNACCGHPRPGESLAEAASRRLFEEIGVETCLTALFSFIYRASDLRSGHTEHEYDHVFAGRFDGTAMPRPGEVAAVRWVSPKELIADMDAHAERYTPWFLLVARRMLQVGFN